MRVIGLDLAFEKNSSAVAVAEVRDRRLEILHVREWQPGRELLQPSEVLFEIILTARRFRVSKAVGDLHYRALAKEYLSPAGYTWVDAPNDNAGRRTMLTLIRQALLEERLRLPEHDVLLSQLKSMRVEFHSGGRVSILHQKDEMRHGDLAMAVLHAVWGLRAELARNVSGRMISDRSRLDEVMDSERPRERMF